MLRKTFYLLIGLCVLFVLAIGFLSLRSDVPDAPIVIYKAVEPLAKSTPTTPTAEARTISASMATDETAVVDKNAEMPARSDASEYAEFSRAELLERFPQYDFHNPASRANLRDILRGEKTFAEKEERLAFLKRYFAEQETARELHDYLDRTMSLLETEYADVEAFSERYPDAQEADFIREFPDATERHDFLERLLEAGKIRKELADRLLAAPFLVEILPPRTLEILHDTANALSIDEISAAQANLERLRSRRYQNNETPHFPIFLDVCICESLFSFCTSNCFRTR